jgi:DNA uptake protein ComE-like DNA-binding protein
MSLRNISLALFTLGCAADLDPHAAPSTFALTLPATDAALVLELANYPGIDIPTLDDVVGLDARAAVNIAQYRAGADGVFPSADDDYFDDVEELDSVPYVGDIAFQRMHAYAQAHRPPSAESVESVSFRGWESEAVVYGVNTATLETLDGMLDARAAQSLIAGRPYASVTQMGPRSYVGTSALDRLRREAPVWWVAHSGMSTPPGLAGTFDTVEFDEATAQIALDIANRATREQMVNEGVYAAGAAAIVGNRPYANLAAVAAVSGVGASTMRGLHAYASSGHWTATDPGPTDPGPTDPPTPPDTNCVFGLRYRDMFAGGATIVTASRRVDPGTSTNATQRAQILAAVRHAYEDVTTLTQAFEAVDENYVNQVEVWDASNRRPFTAYEYGAGDNSYGLVFEHGTTNVAAQINDGDLYECTAMWGDEMRPCERTEDCAEGLTCSGTSEDVSTGRCLNLRAEEHEAEGTSCVLESGCPPASGLVCAGAYTDGSGYCRPAWMRGHFESEYDGAAIPDNDPAGLTLALPVYGLASVDTDVLIDLWIDHPRPADLRVTLVNPATAEVVVFDNPSATGGEIWYRDRVVRGFSGDEQVNGIWQLRVVDRTGGNVGAVYRFGLTITSRWD